MGSDKIEGFRFKGFIVSYKKSYNQNLASTCSQQSNQLIQKYRHNIVNPKSTLTPSLKIGSVLCAFLLLTTKEALATARFRSIFASCSLYCISSSLHFRIHLKFIVTTYNQSMLCSPLFNRASLVNEINFGKELLIPRTTS